jgi:hypothetical protein
MSLALARVQFKDRKGSSMETNTQDGSKAILIENLTLPAAKCEECGAKIYPGSLLEPHLMRHQRRHRWFMKELKKLQQTMAHMREMA